MIDLLVMLIVSIPLVFHPSPSQSSQLKCPANTLEDAEIRAIAAGHCRFGEEAALDGIPVTAASNQSENGTHIYLPSILTEPALQNSSDEALDGASPDNASSDIERIIDKNLPQEKHHIVRPAETLQKIARMYDSTVDLLLLANPYIVNRDLIHVGDRLRIPSAAETETLREEAERRWIEYQRTVVANVPHNGNRWIDVNLQTQTVQAYEGDRLVNSFIASTGTARYPTVKGQYRIWIKLKTDDMRGPGYDLKDVPYVMYFHKGYGLHGTYWHNNFGTPMSHGCVNLRTEDAAWLFDFSSIGTLVNVH